jgi:hypothetical protein
MKRALTLITLMTLVSSMAWSQFIEEFRSAPNRRPPGSLTAQIDGFQAPRDINGNGSEDLRGIYRDSLFFRDGRTFEILLSWKVEEGESIQAHDFSSRPPGDPFEEIKVTFAAGYQDRSNPGINIYDVDNGNVVYTNPNMVFVGVADFDQGGKAEILAVDVANRQTVILGVKDADLDQNEPEEAPMIDPLGGAYQLELKFQGRPQRRMTDFLDPDEARRKFDANGDGKAEIVLFKVNDQNEETGIEVINPANGNVIWDFDYPAEHLAEMRSKFHGFLDVNGNDELELFFGKNLVVTLDKAVHEIAEGFEIVGFNDFNGDGYPEVIGFNSTEEKVQVWGAPTSTSIVDGPALDGFNVTIGPNPFDQTTHYAFDLTEGADVQLDIINAQGQLVTRLLSGWKEAGKYGGSISGLTQSGLYFAAWRINGHVAQTQQIIKK